MLLFLYVSWQQDNPQNPNLLNVNQRENSAHNLIELGELIDFVTWFEPNLRRSRRKLQKTCRILWPSPFDSLSTDLYLTSYKHR